MGLAAWCVGIARAAFDYDEVLRAHTIWMTAQGLRPYHDFFECHPPYFVLLRWVPRVAGAPCRSLLVLRSIAALGNVLFLAGLVAIGTTFTKRWTWAVLAVAVVGLSPPVLRFLLEFRIDGWGYALTTWSIARFRRRTDRFYRFGELAALTTFASLEFSPKLAILPPLLLAAEALRTATTMRGLAKTLAATVLGLAVAVCAFGLYLVAAGLEPDRVYLLTFRYHALINDTSGFGHGMWNQVRSRPMLLGLVVLGSLLWLADVARRRLWPDSYLTALIFWLVIQALLVASPYKQYYAPWFLLASAFVVVLADRLAMFVWPRVAFGFCCFVVVAMTAGTLANFTSGREQEDQCRIIGWINQVTRPGDHVVAPPSIHPIDRFDTFYVWFNTFNPGAVDTENALRAMPALRRYASVGRYQEELASHPPALICLASPAYPFLYPDVQSTALVVFARRRGYSIVRKYGVTAAIRPDRVASMRGPVPKCNPLDR